MAAVSTGREIVGTMHFLVEAPAVVESLIVVDSVMEAPAVVESLVVVVPTVLSHARNTRDNKENLLDIICSISELFRHCPLVVAAGGTRVFCPNKRTSSLIQ